MQVTREAVIYTGLWTTGCVVAMGIRNGHRER